MASSLAAEIGGGSASVLGDFWRAAVGFVLVQIEAAALVGVVGPGRLVPLWLFSSVWLSSSA